MTVQFYNEKDYIYLVNKSKLANCSMQKLLLNSAKHSLVIQADTSIIQKAILEMNRIGNNINQIVKIVNEYDNKLIDDLTKEFRDLSDEIYHLIYE